MCGLVLLLLCSQDNERAFGATQKESLVLNYHLSLYRANPIYAQLQEQAATRFVKKEGGTAHNGKVVPKYELKPELDEDAMVDFDSVLDEEMSFEDMLREEKAAAAEDFTNDLIAQLLEVNPEATEQRLRERLRLNPDGSIISWDLAGCRLVALPKLFGSVCTSGDLLLSNNQLSSLPDRFGSITVGGDLSLAYNQLSSLPQDFKSITVGGNLLLDNNPELEREDVPTELKNVKGRVTIQ